MSSLYPLKFKSIFKDKIWGGDKIKTILGKDFFPLPNCGESWEISGVKGSVSVVKDGPLKGKSLPVLIDEYKGNLIGEKVYKKFGNEFPLLIKFLDANDDLSIQVHPEDQLAKQRHNSFGKTEMWYVFHADEGAIVNSGFNRQIDKETYLKHLNDGTLHEILNIEKVEVGDVFFMPAGRVHYIGKGICLAEIQQTSDITYRIYDFDRKDEKGNKRELHTEDAVDAIDYTHYENYKTNYKRKTDEAVSLVSCPYFTTNLIHCTQDINRDYLGLDSFVIYICFEGELELDFQAGKIDFSKGDSILLPAEIKNVTIRPKKESKFLEVFIN